MLFRITRFFLFILLVSCNCQQKPAGIKTPASGKNCMVSTAHPLATEAGTNRAANTAMLGFWAAIVGVVSKNAMRQAVADSVPPKTIDLNLKVFDISFEQGKKVSSQHTREG